MPPPPLYVDGLADGLVAFVSLKLGDRVGLFAFDSRPRLASGPANGAAAFPLLQRQAAGLDYSTEETNYTLGLTTLIDVIVVFLFTKPMVTLLARTRFYGQGHRLSGLDPARLGARSPWRGARRPPRPATGGSATASRARTTTKEA